MHPNPVYSEHPGQNAFVQRSATRIQAGVGNMHPTNIQAGTLRHHENALNIQAGNSFAPQHGRTPNQEQHPIDHHQAGVGNMHLTSCQARQDKQCNQPGDESPRDASESTKVCHPSPVPSCSPGVPNLRTEKCTLAKPKPSCRPDVLTSHDLDLRKQTQQCIPQHDSTQQLGGEDTEAEHDHVKPKIMPRTTTCQDLGTSLKEDTPSHDPHRQLIGYGTNSELKHEHVTTDQHATQPTQPDGEGDMSQASEEFERAILAKCQEIEQAQHRANTTESFQKGGVPGFSSKNPSESGAERKFDQIQVAEGGALPPPSKAEQSIVKQTPDEESEEPHSEERIPVYVAYNHPVPTLINVRPGTTVGQLAVACSKLNLDSEPGAHLAVSTAVGSQVSVSSPLHPGAIVIIEELTEVERSNCQAHLPEGIQKIPKFTPSTRQEMLWQQKGWVAFDEMTYYIQMLGAYPAGFHHPIQLDDSDEAQTNLCQNIINMLKLANVSQRPQCIPVLRKNHWFPMAVHPEEKMQVFTTPMQTKLLANCLDRCLPGHAVEPKPSGIRQMFEADCGFQTVGWMINQAIASEPTNAVSPDQACHWRLQFHDYLIEQGMHEMIIRRPIPIGGMANATDDLAKLIQKHGVAANRSLECADQLIAATGVSAIQRILAAPKAWADLKARASMCRPPIRIVSSDELQQMIKKKVDDGRPVGKKQNKVKSKQQEPFLRLKAEQISVPPAVFKQQNGDELAQITPGQISPTCKGVIIANIEESVPYFALQAPMTSEGLALLVLDYQDPRLPAAKEIIKLPALCNATNEPLIATVAMLQLGSQTVMRNAPSECIQVQETPHVVIRAAVYRDQWPGNWDELAKGPVRKLMETKAMSSIPTQDILDVWDRQFLAESLRKEEPTAANIFMVNARIQQQHAESLIQQSGTQGCYFEMRSPDGRHPHDSQQVIWLPKRSFAEAAVAVQTSKTPCTLARSGNRYGLRVDHCNAEKTHAQHRPEVIFLNGHELKKFKVGPLPFGSTKSSLASLFKTGAVASASSWTSRAGSG